MGAQVLSIDHKNMASYREVNGEKNLLDIPHGNSIAKVSLYGGHPTWCHPIW